jgi:hypothetical protein
MKHLKNFNESNKSENTSSKDNEELINKFKKLLDDKDVSRSQKLTIKKIISDIESGKYQK